MIVGVLKENHLNEKRVSLTPYMITSLNKLGYEVLIEKDAGLSAGFANDEYLEKGAKAMLSAKELIAKADIIVGIHTTLNCIDHSNEIKAKHIIIGLLNPFFDKANVEKLIQAKATLFSLELMPRISRAQSMDVLSSGSTVLGYKAVLLAANLISKFFPMIMMSGTTIKPAKILVVGAGVTGLQAIATARRLGADVYGYDIREEAIEQIKSLGAAGLMPMPEKDADTLLLEHTKDADIIFCTANIIGKKSPIIISKEMVDGMMPGSLILDLVSEYGGNCELCKKDETIITDNKVTIMSPSNLASDFPYHGSAVYSKNMSTYLQYLLEHYKERKFDLEDDVIKSTMIAANGESLKDFL